MSAFRTALIGTALALSVVGSALAAAPDDFRIPDDIAPTVPPATAPTVTQRLWGQVKSVAGGDKWYFLQINGLDYDDEVFKSDPWLAIETISGRVKFIQYNGTAKLGYITTIDLGKAGAAAFSYAARGKLMSELAAVPHPSMPQLSYGISFTFQLLDHDGFVLKEVQSKREWVKTGESNTLQAVVDEAIDLDLVAKSASVKFKIAVDECYACH